MRRLGGSRWRLRRTRCAMGFERQLVAESKTGRELANWNGGLVIVEGIAGASRGVRTGSRQRVAVAWAHECIGVLEHIPGSIVMDTLRRIEVRAC